jgi:exodeoxyribonuclease VIII
MEYSKVQAVNWSTLKAMKSSPADYKLAVTFPREETDSMRLGTLVHMMLLEPEKVEQNYVLMPKLDFRKTENKQKRAELIESNPGKIIAPEEGDTFSYAKAEKIVEANKRKPITKHLLMDVEQVEKKIFSTCTETGLPLKGIADVVTRNSLVDIKTTNSMGKIFYNIKAFDYLGQLAFYNYLLKLDGIKRDRHHLFFIETTAPYKAKVVTVDPAVIAKEHDINLELLKKVKACRDKDYWPDNSHIATSYREDGEREDIQIFQPEFGI